MTPISRKLLSVHLGRSSWSIIVSYFHKAVDILLVLYIGLSAVLDVNAPMNILANLEIHFLRIDQISWREKKKTFIFIWGGFKLFLFLWLFGLPDFLHVNLDNRYLDFELQWVRTVHNVLKDIVYHSRNDPLLFFVFYRGSLHCVSLSAWSLSICQDCYWRKIR